MPAAPKPIQSGDKKKKKDYAQRDRATSDMGKDYTAGIEKPKGFKDAEVNKQRNPMTR